MEESNKKKISELKVEGRRWCMLSSVATYAKS